MALRSAARRAGNRAVAGWFLTRALRARARVSPSKVRLGITEHCAGFLTKVVSRFAEGFFGLEGQI